jgi:predicted nucleotide-binding protein
LVQSRDKKSPMPRDNVLFELGFFMSRLGRSRTLLLVPKNEEVKLPSDFKGLTPIRYQKGSEAVELAVALGPCIDRINGLVKKMGVRSSIAIVK